MDIQFFITVNLMMLSLLAVAVTLISRRSGGEAWITINAVLVLIGSAALYFFPAWSGIIMICAAVPLVLVPALLSAMARRRASQNRLQDAAFYSRLASFLHPVKQSHFNSELMQALAITDSEASIAALSKLEENATPEQLAIVHGWICRARDDWEGALKATEGMHTNPNVAVLRVRAFGEIGRLDEMAHAYNQAKTLLSGAQLFHTQLFVLAFCGRLEGVGFMIQHQLDMLPDDAKAYWAAVAALSSGNEADEARQIFHEIAETGTEERVRVAARRRLVQTPGDAPITLSPETAAVADNIEARLRLNAQRYAIDFRQIPATLSLLAVIVGMYFIEILRNGTEDTTILIEMGALWPPLLLENGEWWRIGTALFLHFGTLHVLVNSVSLFLVGRIVENLVGSVRLLTVFLLGGMISSLAVLAAMAFGLTHYAVLIGASGAIFAILGLEASRQMLNWLKSRDILDSRELMLLLVIVFVQFSIDLSIPEISFTAHASGLLGGLIIGLVMALTN
ncbi:MAG: rhomboid family intramembrane serine protease, partial [Alphaproteobacteria bacterium]